MTVSSDVYRFGGASTAGDASMAALLGGKGANLAEMARIGIPVPPGCTVTTKACLAYLEEGRLGTGVAEDIMAVVTAIGQETGRSFGSATQPLLLSVRSGAPVSMPGMMDSILNLGMNDATARLLAQHEPDFAWDAYRRLLEMYGDVVAGIDADLIRAPLQEACRQEGKTDPMTLSVAAKEQVCEQIKQVYRAEAGTEFPQEPREQLLRAVEAVFRSWHNKRARIYRSMHGIDDAMGTAVNIQMMVFGNHNENSGTGVGFTRDPATGTPGMYGEFLVDAQGEDVVAGVRTPRPISGGAGSLQEWSPTLHAELKTHFQSLENHFADMQDIEFTIQDGTLYILQTRRAKRTVAASVRCAVDMVADGLITREEAICRVDAASLDQLLHPSVDADKAPTAIAQGLAASPGAATGRIAFTAEQAAELAEKGNDVILVRQETSAEDIGGMQVSKGILTVHGGVTSHAAVVARGIGIPCVSGAGSLEVDAKAQTLRVADNVFTGVDTITIDGASGSVYAGEVPLLQAALGPATVTLLGWADEIRTLGVRANADRPEDAVRARAFGAEGIGLCRTEHMFFAPERLLAMREMILADTVDERRQALARLRPWQQADFEGLFKAMDGLPVVIRLLDPPLHEFMPGSQHEINELASAMRMSVEKVQTRIAQIHENNPMLGHRGCRLAISFPEIYEMQVEAIGRAYKTVLDQGVQAHAEIMVPLVADVAELRWLRARLHDTLNSLPGDETVAIPIGTMIELPRAAIRARDIAAEAAFFSFGTNDLTQSTWGLSRDDAGTFLPEYIEKGVLAADPFASLDQQGVGYLMKFAVDQGRQGNPKLAIGICGEQGGDPASIQFCHKIGLDYVSASPFRILTARLAAAQAAIQGDDT